MRFLNKVIFINSATIPYSEVTLDGNVHFIGTQGVGKSTLLRAILFFYNADTLRLGIPKEKKSFSEYYYPYQNSYLIYEVMRESGPYCIIAFKSQGKACFRFVDAAYDKKYFISVDGKAFENWDASRAGLDSDKIFYTRKIDRYEEYRDILYGNNDGKRDFRKYALLESRQYQNIPRTIQNVFLNAKLEAEFIKQTIIMSLNEEDIEINLQDYSHHLKDFELQLADINQFKQPAVLKQADNVIRYHGAIRHLEKEKIQLSLQLAWALDHIQRIEPKLSEKLEKEEEGKNQLQQKLADVEKRFQAKTENYQKRLGELDYKLNTAKLKAKEYEEMNILEIAQRVSKKANLENEQHSFSKEKDLLSAQYREVTQKYESLLAILNESLKAFELTKDREKLKLKEASFQFKGESKEVLDEVIKEIRQRNKQEVESAKEKVESKKEAVQQLKVKYESIRYKRFYEEEIRKADNDYNQAGLLIQQSKNQLAHLRSSIETIQKHWELDESTINQKTQTGEADYLKQLEEDQQNIDKITIKLENNKHSLFGWLSENYKGWEATIGKVCDEDLLFQDDLSPKMTQNKEGGLFGVQLNLSEVRKAVKTLEDYEEEKSDLFKKMATLKSALKSLLDSKIIDIEKIKKKYQPKINELKDGVREQEYSLEQNRAKQEQAKLLKEGLQTKAKGEKEQALNEIMYSIDALTEELIQAQNSLTTVEEEIDKQIRAKEREYQRKVEANDKKLKEEYEQLEKDLKVYRLKYEKQKQEISSKQQNELAGKGADTIRLSEIERRLNEIKTELEYIDANRNIVAVYYNDKKELLDKVDEFRNRKSLLEQGYEIEVEKNRQKKQSLFEEMSKIDESINNYQLQIDKIKEDLNAFERFQVTEVYRSLGADDKGFKEESRTDKRCVALIDELNQSYYTGIRRLDELKESANKFIGYFSSQNIFSFPTNLAESKAYLLFAEHINEFIADNKIEEYERRINERFASIIHSLGKETSNLLSKSGEIQNVISNINKDFERKNFVGAIKKIELRLVNSSNNVVRTLTAVKTFNDEHAYDIGGMNLFSSQDQDLKNKKAVDLLKQLVKAISEFKKETISLSDSFELEFRIEENQNDTGWVEKLSHVGSEGTDVLVKAMINIMLLNVFKEGASKRFKDFRLHCMMDEIGKLHPNNVKGILQFANDRNILLINGSPTENNALDYRHIYKLEKDAKSFTKVKRIITNYAQA
jgi:hypothetical protein